MYSIQETTHVHSESEVRVVDNSAHAVPVQSSFVHPDNDIEIDFEREIEYYSTVAHATNEAEQSESELRLNDSNANARTNAHASSNAHACDETCNTTQLPEFTDEQWNNYEKSESSDEESDDESDLEIVTNHIEVGNQNTGDESDLEVVTNHIQVGKQNTGDVCRGSQDLTPIEDRIELNSLDEDFIEQDESQYGSCDWIPNESECVGTTSSTEGVETTPNTDSFETTASSE